jgi:hypothetical protein
MPENRRLMIRMDRHLLRAYSFLKRYVGLADGTVSCILKRF